MAEEHSFSAQVKDELAHLMPESESCQQMELAALLRACGRIGIRGAGSLSCSLSTNHAAVARKIIRLIKSGFALHPEVVVMRRRRLRKNLLYQIKLPAQSGLMEMLQATGVVDEGGQLHEWADLPALKNDDCCRAYLRGTFLGTGWVASPERQHHLEMTTVATEAADGLGQILFRYGIAIRMASRKESLLLYMKEANQITRFLTLVGAHQALLRYEDVRVLKGMKNHINRQVNAETANLEKTIEAAGRQLEALKRLQLGGGLERLSLPLRELARLRLNHPDVSLRELGEMCQPPVGKSGVNHRMRLLLKLAESNSPR